MSFFSNLLPCCHFQVVNLRSAPPESQIQNLAKMMWFGGDIFICRSKTWTAMWFGGEINEREKVFSQGNWGMGQAEYLIKEKPVHLQWRHCIFQILAVQARPSEIKNQKIKDLYLLDHWQLKVMITLTIFGKRNKKKNKKRAGLPKSWDDKVAFYPRHLLRIFNPPAIQLQVKSNLFDMIWKDMQEKVCLGPSVKFVFPELIF